MAREFVVDENRKLRDVTPSGIGTSMPIGSLMWFAAKKVPDSWLICDGRAISRTTYASLFSVIGTTFGAGDGSTTFNLPNIIDRFIEGALEAGRYIEAGLPNITGHVSLGSTNGGQNWLGDWSLSNGAFKAASDTPDKGKYPSLSAVAAVSGGTRASFDAARSSDVYGKSNTVQPPALTMVPCIKAFGSVAEDDTEVVARLVKKVAAFTEHNSTSMTFYVRTDGDDENGDGLTPETAFRTVSRAYEAAFPYTQTVLYYPFPKNIIIDVGAGNFAGLYCSNPMGFPVKIVGAGVDVTTFTPVDDLGNFTFAFYRGALCHISNCTIIGGKHSAVMANHNSQVALYGSIRISLNDSDYGIVSAEGSQIWCNASESEQRLKLTMDGSVAYHAIHVVRNSGMYADWGTYSINLAPSRSGIVPAFILSSLCSDIIFGTSNSISGSFNGAYRYDVNRASALDVQSAGANRFPGTIAGVVSFGGFYG